MGSLMTRLKDIAVKAGTTVPTVSKALNGHPDIAEETKILINRIADELQYQTASYPRAKNRKASKLIGLIVPEVTSNFFAVVFTHIESFLKNSGYSPIFYICNFKVEQECDGLELFCRRGVDGIILAHIIDADIGPQLHRVWDAYKIPVILIGTINRYPEFNNVLLDDEAGIFDALSHLLSKHHTKFCFLADTETHYTRFFAFKAAMEKHGLPINEQLIVGCGEERDEKGGYLCMQELLRRIKPPAALFMGYDLMAIGAIRAAFEAGFAIPGDFAVIGNDNMSSAAYLRPSLSTIVSPVQELARHVVDLIVNNLENPENHVIRTVSIKAEFIPRETS
jgi:LacI family transcriptional regulator